MGLWNWLDWVLAIVLIASVIPAVQKGFVRELISLAAVVLAIVIAAMEYPRAAIWYTDLTKSQDVAMAAGFLTIFVIILGLGAIASAVAKFLVKTAGVEWFDRFMGGVFGLIRGVIIDSILLMILMTFAIKPWAVDRSELAPYVSTGARFIALMMPRDIRDHFHSGFEKFRQTIMNGTKNGSKTSGL